jgi:hypothetical protein
MRFDLGFGIYNSTKSVVEVENAIFYSRSIGGSVWIVQLPCFDDF